MSTNEELQPRLDKIKYFESLEAGKDLSGCMYYCEYCGFKGDGFCKVNHQYRSEHKICATSYNRYHRKKYQQNLLRN